MEEKFNLRLVLFLLIMVIGRMQYGEAQLYRGFISGTVSDSSNAVIAGVQVTITNTGTNISRDTLTNDVGFYRFVAVEPGNYSVQFRLAGFESQTIPNISVSTAQEVVINRILAASGGATEITIEATPGAVLGKTIPTIERTLSQRVVSELPLQTFNNGRDISRLAVLAPTVNRASGSNEMAGNGQRARNNNFMIDGVDNNDLNVSVSSARTIPEAVQEVQIQTTSYSAEFGRNTGIQFSAITKSGTNAYHGEVWDYYRGNWMEPLSLTDKRAGFKATPRFVQNQFGGDIGGPIIKDRTFFFGLLEVGLRREAAKAGNATSATVVTPAGFAALSGVPLGPNQTGASRQAVLSALGFLPEIYPQISNYDNLRNVTVNNVPIQVGQITIPLERPYTTYYTVFRIDHRPGQTDNLSYRYHIDKRDLPNITGNTTFGNRFAADGVILRQNHAISYTRPFTPRFLNEARVAYVRQYLDFQERDPLSPFVGVSGLFSFGGSNALPQGRIEELSQLQDVATYVAGRNSLKFGMDVRLSKLKRGRFVVNSKGTFTFASLQDYINNDATTIIRGVSQSGPGGLDAEEWSHYYFFQDDIKATRDLTLNLGLRYEYTTVPLGFLGTTNPLIRAMGVAGPAKPDKNNWAPRVGFAYSPSAPTGMFGRLLGNGKTSIRGGFGVAYDVIFYNILINTFQSFPYITNVQVNRPATLNMFPRIPDLPSSPGQPNPAFTFINVPEDIENPTTHFWSLSVQREFGSNRVLEIGYTGNRSYHNLRQSQANPGVLTPAQAAAAIAAGNPAAAGVTRMNPAWGSRQIIESGAKGEYHAGYVKFDRRLSRGLLVGANYTWSANLSDADEPQNIQDTTTGAGLTPSTPQIPQNFLDFGREWSRSAFDRPHRFVIHYLYEIPWFATGSSALRQMFGGWQVSGFTEYQSGQPFTITTGADTLGAIGLSTFPGRPNYNPSGIFRNDPVTGDLRTFATPIDGTGIVSTPRGANGLPLANSMPGGGNLGRNTFRGPSLQNWNFSIMKKIAIKESWNVQLRSDFFNLWNHNNFPNPVANMSSPAFGTNTSTGFWTDARQITFSAKIRF